MKKVLTGISNFHAKGFKKQLLAASATSTVINPALTQTASARNCFLNPKALKNDMPVKTFFIIIIPKIMYVVAL